MTKNLEAVMIQLKIFEGINSIDQEVILDKYFTRKTYNANESIVKKGELGEDMFILLDGMVKVKVSGRLFIDLNPGNIFGEVCLIDGGTRSASVIAGTTANLASLNRKAFELFLKERPKDASIFLYNLVRVLISRLRKTVETVGESEMGLKQMQRLLMKLCLEST
jgi:CRP-like cAMP-binding protein